jgi:hypothetical protein
MKQNYHVIKIVNTKIQARKKVKKFHFLNIYKILNILNFFQAHQFETFSIKNTNSFDHQIWSSFNIGKILRSTLNEKYPLEYFKLDEYSKDIICKYFNNISTSLGYMCKTIDGYSIYRLSVKNSYILKINIKDNEIIIKKSIP